MKFGISKFFVGHVNNVVHLQRLSIYLFTFFASFLTIFLSLFLSPHYRRLFHPAVKPFLYKPA
jgi:hypothetical protein